MTKMIIDNKATAAKAYEVYIVDRDEYQTLEHLKQLAAECMNDDVYKVTVFEDGVELFTIRNYK